MKKILGCTILLLLLFTGAQAQDFDLDDIMGEAQDFFGEAQDDAEKAADTEAQRKFKEAFKDKFKKLGEFTENLDNYSADTKCAYLIFKYKMEIDSLVARTKAEENCKKKYDLYGMQLTAMMSSTTIMYCSEDLYNLFNSRDNGFHSKNNTEKEEEKEKLKQLVTDITQILQDGGKKFGAWSYGRGDPPNDFEKTFLISYQNLGKLMSDSTPYYDKEDDIVKPIQKILNKYFHPVSLLGNTVAISKEMDKLKPCADSTH